MYCMHRVALREFFPSCDDALTPIPNTTRTLAWTGALHGAPAGAQRHRLLQGTFFPLSSLVYTLTVRTTASPAPELTPPPTNQPQHQCVQVEFIRPVSNTPETPPHAFDIQSVMREWTVCANDQVPLAPPSPLFLSSLSPQPPDHHQSLNPIPPILLTPPHPHKRRTCSGGCGCWPTPWTRTWRCSPTTRWPSWSSPGELFFQKKVLCHEQCSMQLLGGWGWVVHMGGWGVYAHGRVCVSGPYGSLRGTKHKKAGSGLTSPFHPNPPGTTRR